jgi:hypothetical protein
VPKGSVPDSGYEFENLKLTPPCGPWHPSESNSCVAVEFS